MKNDEITFLIIAQNEEKRIARAVQSCIQIGKVLVIDGGSTDATVTIAKELGAEVIQNTFKYAAQQYNFGLEQIQTKWAFILDADERVGLELGSSIRAVDSNSPFVAFWTDRINYFAGKPIHHSGWSPDRNVRLLNVSQSRYDDRPVHARVIADGELGKLKGPIHHFTYSTITQYVTKLNRFTSREVEARVQTQKVLDSRSRWRAIYLRMPAKGVVRFIYMYILRVGFLDGRTGFDLARMSANYETVVALKQRYDAHQAADDEPANYV